MNSQNKQIQVIINEIDEVLNQPSTSNSPVALKQTLRKSQKILEQILDYESQDVDKASSPQIVSFNLSDNLDNLSEENQNPIEPSAKQDKKKLDDFLDNFTNCLEEELKILQNQRQALLEEIRQLEKRRQQNYSLAQQYAKQQQIIDEFSQALLGPVQETLIEQLSQLANKHSSQIQSSFASSKSHRPQTIEDIETSELMTISVDNLEEDDNFSESFVDDSNIEDSDINLPAQINYTETELILEKKQQVEKSPQNNELTNQITETVLPYPGYEFLNTTDTDTESKKQENLGILKSQNSDYSNTDLLQENILNSHLEAPSFEENDSEEQDYQYQTSKIEDRIEIDSHELPELPPKNISKFEQTENKETAEIESLSDIFGELDINETESEQLDFSEEVKSYQKTTAKQTTQKKDKDTYIHASNTENLLPVKESEKLLQNRELLLLDTNTLEQLRSDLEYLEEIDPNESTLVDDPEATKLQLGEYNASYSAESITNSSDNPFKTTSEAEFTDLENLFNTISEESNASYPEILSVEEEEEEEDMEYDPTLEDILDSLTLSTNDDETEIETETDNYDFSELEILLQDTPNQEKKKLNQPETAATLENLEPDSKKSQENITASPLESKSTKIKSEINNLKSNQTTSQWYLGIDFGTTGISAALLNRSSSKIYPLCWQRVGTKLELDIPMINQEFTLAKNSHQNDLSSTQKIYRLPSVVYLDAKLQVIDDAEEITEQITEQITRDQAPLLLQNFKPALKVSIPYVSIKFRREKLKENPEESFLLASNFGASTSHQPVLQWSEHEQIPLRAVKQGLVALLTNFKPQANVFNQSISLPGGQTQTAVITDDYVCEAVGLDRQTFISALAQLKGVIMGCPASWPEAYRFNLREAVLEANLVTDVSQVMVISDAIATAVSELTTVTEDCKISSNSKLRTGGILFVNVGATTTELALVNVPENMENLTYSHFHCHSFAYGGHALDQDIVCQLLLKDENSDIPSQNQDNKQKSAQGWPQPGYPDLSIRYQLQQWLQSSSYRQGLLEAARNLKVILPSEKEFTLNIGDRIWFLQQTDLETKVLEPFLKQLNHELNSFLSKVGMSPVGINRAICTGGGGVWSALPRWLRQKLPNAIIHQDGIFDTLNVGLGKKSGRGSDDIDDIQDIKLITGRVAYGLASLPIYPQILDIPQQQYSDYFLLWEILRVFPDRPVSVKEIMQLLEERGINTRVCQERIKGIVKSQLPTGLIPSDEDLMLLSEVSRQNSDYQGLTAKPLFSQEADGQKYSLSHEQAEYVRQYLNKLVASSGQKLEEPLLKYIEKE